jgi:hypothetical protein
LILNHSIYLNISGFVDTGHVVVYELISAAPVTSAKVGPRAMNTISEFGSFIDFLYIVFELAATDSTFLKELKN